MFSHQRSLPRVMLWQECQILVCIVGAFTQQCLLFMMHYFRHATDFDLGIKKSCVPHILRINNA